MDEVACARIRLKPGSLDRLRAWASDMHARKAQAQAHATLAAEGVWIESVFQESSDGGDFLVCSLV